jgi:hypothetical protein
MKEGYTQQHGMEGTMEGITHTECSLLITTIYALNSCSRKPTISFVMSVRPFEPVEQRRSRWADFREILR